MSRPAAILFDWDNTLVDNWSAIHDALNATFIAFDKPTWTLEEAMGRVRESMRDSFPRLFAERWTEARDHFYAGFRARHLDRLRGRMGAERLLALCATTGIPAAVVSNKNGALLRAEVAHLNWKTWFGAVLGAGDSARDKPDPQPAYDALAALEIHSFSDVWFIGDTETDVDCATAAGLIAILLPGTPNVPPRPQALSFGSLEEIADAIADACGIDRQRMVFT